MGHLFPKKNPEAAKKLLETPDDELDAAERQLKYILGAHMTPMPCPMCFEKISIYDAADDTLDVGTEYAGRYVCPSCQTELTKVVPFYLQPGTPGWHWRRMYPLSGKREQGDGRGLSLQELEVLIAAHDAVTLLVARARCRHDPSKVGVVTLDSLPLVSPERLDAYLQAQGWTIDQTEHDDARRTWRRTDGAVCTTHRKRDAEIMAVDVESVALGENCSVLRILVGLLVLWPLP